MLLLRHALRCFALGMLLLLLGIGWPAVGQQKDTAPPSSTARIKELQTQLTRLRRLVREQVFRTVDQEHWGYQACTTLQQKGILLGYPEGYFTGKKRLLSRCEFAVAIMRIQVRSHPEAYPAHKDPVTGPPPDPPLPKPLEPQMQRLIERLEAEFHTELALLTEENLGDW